MAVLSYDEYVNRQNFRLEVIARTGGLVSGIKADPSAAAGVNLAVAFGLPEVVAEMLAVVAGQLLRAVPGSVAYDVSALQIPISRAQLPGPPEYPLYHGNDAAQWGQYWSQCDRVCVTVASAVLSLRRSLDGVPLMHISGLVVTKFAVVARLIFGPVFYQAASAVFEALQASNEDGASFINAWGLMVPLVHFRASYSPESEAVNAVRGVVDGVTFVPLPLRVDTVQVGLVSRDDVTARYVPVLTGIFSNR